MRMKKRNGKRIGERKGEGRQRKWGRKKLEEDEKRLKRRRG